MQKIKIAYEWIGPNGPLMNSKIPDIYDLAVVMPGVEITTNNRGQTSHLYPSLFSHFPDKFELTPAYLIKPEDYFIYDYQFNYLIPFDDIFSVGVPTGLLESIEVSHNILDGLKNGNGYFLLDVSMESFVKYYVFAMIHEYFTAKDIPLHKIIYVTGCPNGSQLYDEYCLRANITDDNNKIRILEWDAFEWQISQRHANDEYFINKNIKDIEKTFLSLNFRYREHRMDLLSLFIKHDLLKDSYFTFPAFDPDHPTRDYLHSVNRQFLERIDLTIEEVEYVQHNMLPLSLQNNSVGYHDHRKFTLDENRSMKFFYDTSLISIVTETLAYGTEIAETEKTFKPIIYKQPFILVGAPGSLKYLHNKGYKTFSNWFDESYDSIEDPWSRMIEIGNVCKEINSWDNKTKQKFIDETSEVVNHNYDNLRNIYGKVLSPQWGEIFKK